MSAEHLILARIDIPTLQLLQFERRHDDRLFCKDDRRVEACTRHGERYEKLLH